MTVTDCELDVSDTGKFMKIAVLTDPGVFWGGD